MLVLFLTLAAYVIATTNALEPGPLNGSNFTTAANEAIVNLPFFENGFYPYLYLFLHLLEESLFIMM
jgi:hypothetical protein